MVGQRWALRVRLFGLCMDGFDFVFGCIDTARRKSHHLKIAPKILPTDGQHNSIRPAADNHAPS